MYSDKIIRKFWSNINKNGTLQPDGSRCWEWTADRRGLYGRISIGDKSVATHRFAYTLMHGPIPEKNDRGRIFVRHLVCDNKICCNVAHLELGTHQDNMNDKTRKNRQATGLATKPWLRAKGEANGRSKLSADDVRSILIIWSTELYSRTQIAGMYGVTRPTIAKIVDRRAWKTV